MPIGKLRKSFFLGGATTLALLSMVAHGQGITTQYEFNERGDPEEIIESNGRTTSVEYDILGRVETVELMDGRKQVIHYSPEHLIDRVEVFASDQTSVLTSEFLYNSNRQVETIISPGGGTETRHYDELSRLENSVDADGRISRYVYDVDGTILCVLQGVGTSLQLSERVNSYSFWGQVSAVWPARGSNADCSETNDIYRTTYTPDPFGRPVLTTYPDGSEHSTSLHPNGSLDSEVTRRGDLVNYFYDSFGRVEKTDWNAAGDGSSILEAVKEETFDSSGKVKTSSVDFEGAVVSVAYNYDQFGRLQEESRSDGLAVAFAYDDHNNRTTIVWPDGWTARYVYDQLGRLREVWADPDGVAPCADADNSCELDFVGNGDEWLLEKSEYDVFGRLKSKENGGRRGDFALASSYDYDAAGRLDEFTHVVGGDAQSPDSVTWSYDYYPSGKLKATGVDRLGWLWDGASARSKTYPVANVLDQYSEENTDGDIQTFTYDDGGRVESIVSTSTQSDLRHDARGFLVEYSSQAEGATNWSVDYAYDPTGRRIGKNFSNAVTNYIYLHAGDMEIAEYNGAGNLLARYVPGLSVDSRVAMITSDDQTHYYVADRQGNVIGTVEETADSVHVSDRYQYSPFGVEENAATSGNPYRYTGRRFDAETGFLFYRARYYMPATGRFLQPDPIGYEDQMNLYTYVANDPVNAIDPSGMESDLRLPKVTVTIPRLPKLDPLKSILTNFLFNRAEEVGTGLRRMAKEEFKKQACKTPPIGGALGVDAYAGPGTTLQSGVSLDPTDGQISVFGSVGVGGGVTLAGNALPAPLPYGAAVLNAPSGITGNFTVNASGTTPVGLGGGVSRSLVGTNQGETSVSVLKAAPGTGGNINFAGEGSLPITPGLYDLGCDEAD